ncbi:MAG TPA: hypothetical protein VK272_11390 [Solirubrobacteraceae bacterium]|nr:hypothetical protein [Solirubrobacteraceae bacterium]
MIAFGGIVSSAAQAGTYYRCSAEKKGEFTEAGCATKARKPHKGTFELVQVQACVAQKDGEYVNNTCTQKAGKPKKGKFELTTGRHFTDTTGKATLTVPAFGPNKVECSAGSSAGLITGPKTDVDRITFTGCQLEAKKCMSVGPNGTPSGIEGVITTNLLASELVDHGELGGGSLELEPAAGEAWEEFSSAEHQPYVAEFVCGGEILARVSGVVSGVVAPVNALAMTATRSFAVGLAEQALLTEAFNGVEFVPPGGAPSSLETTATITYEVPIEVKT